jgi:hypothetical protein
MVDNSPTTLKFFLTNQLVHFLANIIGGKIGTLPIKYLGVPLHAKKLRNRD